MLDYRGQIEAKAWALLEANTTFANAYSEGRRIKMSGDGWLRQHAHGSSSDYPEVKIELRDGDLKSSYQRTFAMNSPTFTSSDVDMTVPLSQQLAVIFTYDSLKTTQQTPLEAAAEAAFMGAFPTLGLSYVSGFTYRWTRAEKVINGETRQQVTLLLRFDLRPYLSTITS